MNHLAGILQATYVLWVQMGIYLVFGFAFAGVLSRFLKTETIVRHLGHDTWGAVLKAALFGVPLPLCSCGVIPVGLSLYKRGASRGATTAFLISTPQTGVDSILITYGLLGPLGLVFAIVRPVAAFFNGLLGGAIVTWFDHREAHAAGRQATQTFTHDEACASGDCSIGNPRATPRHVTLWRHARQAFLYAFWEFPREIVKWLLVGIVVAGIVSYLLPADPHFLANYLGTGIWPMLIMAAAGIPLYICATASVPFVAVLLAHGLSPGAALVFLMCGPATNTASFFLLGKMLGWRTMIVYTGSIVATSFAFGGLLNLYFASTGGVPLLDAMHHHESFGFWSVFGAVALLLTTIAALTRNAAEALQERKAREAAMARPTAAAHATARATARAGGGAVISPAGDMTVLAAAASRAAAGRPAGIGIAAVEAAISSTRAEEGAETMGQTVSIRVEGMTCQNCARHVRTAAEAVAGVESAFVDLKKNLLSVTGAALDVAAIRAAVGKAGYVAGEAV